MNILFEIINSLNKEESRFYKLFAAVITFNPTITQISCNTFTDGQVLLNPAGGGGGGYIPR